MTPTQSSRPLRLQDDEDEDDLFEDEEFQDEEDQEDEEDDDEEEDEEEEGNDETWQVAYVGPTLPFERRRGLPDFAR